MPGFNPDLQFPFNLLEIRRRAANFRKLMLIFPYIHPAALHGVIVKNNFNWSRILQVLFASHRFRAIRFWNRVNVQRELEQILQQQGIQLCVCNSINDILVAIQNENQYLINTFIQQPHLMEDYLGLDSTADTPATGYKQNSVEIIIGQKPSSTSADTANSSGGTDVQSNDVVRIIFEKNPQNGGIEMVVENNSAQPKRVTLIDHTGELDELEKAKKKRKQNASTTKPGEKKPRNTKQKRAASGEGAIQPNANNGPEIEASQVVSKKGKATKKTRVKSSKKQTNNTNNNN